MSGPDLQRELQRRGRDIPIVFITAHVDEKLRQRVLGQGAIDCLYKPFSQTDLLARAARRAPRAMKVTGHAASPRRDGERSASTPRRIFSRDRGLTPSGVRIEFLFDPRPATRRRAQ